MALDAGINVFDTANVYGRSVHKGYTEEIIGKWLVARGVRDKVTLITKIYSPMMRWPNHVYLSPSSLRIGIEGCLRRLQTDYVDVLTIHHMDPGLSWATFWSTMSSLLSRGHVLSVGSSNSAAWYLTQGQERAAMCGFPGFVFEESPYNPVERSVESEVIPCLMSYGLPLLAYSPLAGGALASQSADGGVRRASEYTQGISQRLQEPIEGFHRIAREAGMASEQLAISWLLTKSCVFPVIGPRTLAQLSGMLSALNNAVDPDVISLVDDLCGGAARPAPGSYAW